MKIYTRAGSAIPFETFDFPDGQPHVAIPLSGSVVDRAIRIVTPIRNGQDLLRVLLAADRLRAAGALRINLDITYLLGARMDRRIGDGPFTLAVVAQALRAAKFDSIRILDPHSPVALALLDATEMPLHHVIQRVSNVMTPSGARIVIAPDAGASKRAAEFAPLLFANSPVQCLKKRNPDTGQLSDFVVCEPERVRGRSCLILDDLCDGGGTFVGLARELRRVGATATAVSLYVTHGIFSKGLPLEGIDHVYTTNSYQELESTDYLTVLKVY